MSFSVGRRLGGRGEVVEEVLVGHLAEQRAAVVDHDDLRLLGGPRAHDLLEVVAQQRALARLPVAEDEHVRLGRRVDADRRELALVDADEQPLLRELAAQRVLADLVEGDHVGQQPQLGTGVALPGRGRALDRGRRRRRRGCPRRRRRRRGAGRRGSAACSAPGRDPGRPVGTRAATLRSISESSGSPRRSSSLEPKTSRIAARKSAHRPEAAMMWMPKVRPRPASCWSSISMSSNSARSVLQPSTTRKTSP